MARWLVRILAALLIATGVVWWFQIEILLKVVEIAADRRTPVGPNRDISWQAGPDPAGRAPGDRPPNIVLILADDLGWNDLSFAGGGVAGGTVPTPNIDSIVQDGVNFTAGYAANGICWPN